MRQNKNTGSTSIQGVLQFYLSAAQMTAARDQQLALPSSGEDQTNAESNLPKQQITAREWEQPLRAQH